MIKFSEWFSDEPKVEVLTVDAKALRNKIQAYEDKISNLSSSYTRLKDEYKELEDDYFKLEHNVKALASALHKAQASEKKALKAAVWKNRIIEEQQKQLSMYRAEFLDLEA